MHPSCPPPLPQALDMRSGLPVALKMYYMAMLASFNRHQVLREVRLHASLDHPHIIQLYAAFQVRWVGQAY